MLSKQIINCRVVFFYLDSSSRLSLPPNKQKIVYTNSPLVNSCTGMKIINIYLAYDKLNMNCNNYDKFLKKSFNIISYVLQILLVFWNKRFF